mgnify:FL=1
MAFKFDASVDEGQSTDLHGDGGNYLRDPGTYHFGILKLDTDPHDKDGTMIDGISVSLEVLAGTVPGTNGKKLDLTFFNGKLSNKDKGLFARKKQACLFVACNLMHESQFGKGGVSIDDTKAKGQMIVMTVVKRKDKDGNDGKYLDMNFTDCWHIDHPEVAKNKFPLNAEAIKLLTAGSPSSRRDPKSFVVAGAGTGSSSNGSNGSAKSAGTAKETVAAGATGERDLGDL